MSYSLEQTPEELAYLRGAKIHGVEVEDECLVLHLETVDPVDNCEGAVSRRIAVQVWQDEEGNGPGYLALTKVYPTDPV